MEPHKFIVAAAGTASSCAANDDDYIRAIPAKANTAPQQFWPALAWFKLFSAACGF
jgi:hypothetical protein